ncbi:MAG: 3D-(3,5/4)-trihydroxycyclohexane-1,2-dione acylhydrolase (decyclizing) [Anaerolineales bacterium]|nr:3D-(3,5/4)-trihydroxycyclohexane-1,2-dione acylhydrolase (decyclizing) [Anaerolineales bacterium]
MTSVRLTMAQAIIRFLKNQSVERDGVEQPFFAGCFGIFGHGNVAGIGQALQANPDFRYYLARNEQAMVHTAVAFAKVSRRLRALACTSSIGPGATNMVTGAATATINHLPVLLLPGDIFARRNVGPVLQQLETPLTGDISVNDCFKPVSRYWDRLNRPEQAVPALMEAMRVLTSPADTGAVTLALPQDVQAEAYDYPAAFLSRRVWSIPRQPPDPAAVPRAADLIRASQAPLAIAGGGVIFSDATATLRAFAEQTGIPVGETQAGKGSLPYDHPACLGAIGVTGTPGANIMAREADLVIGIGTTYDDFTTASKTAFQNPNVRFLNLNISEFDAHKHGGLALVGDARSSLEALAAALAGWHAPQAYRARARQFNQGWDREVQRIYDLEHGPLISQGEVIGAVNTASGPRDIVLCAAGSLPGDLHKLWRTRDEFGYHLEYGYSCMGYEIAGGLGAKLAAPDRDVYVMVGDGSYLMLAQEIVTAVQEGIKLIIIVLDNHGFASIGGLSEAVGSAGFGTRFRARNPNTGQLDGPPLAIDYAENAHSLGAHVIHAADLTALRAALAEAKHASRTTVIVVETDREQRVGGYESWWDVPVAEVSGMSSVQDAYAQYAAARQRERQHL